MTGEVNKETSLLSLLCWDLTSGMKNKLLMLFQNINKIINSPVEKTSRLFRWWGDLIESVVRSQSLFNLF